MIRRPLRPLARILIARAEGQDPNVIEAEERAARLAPGTAPSGPRPRRGSSCSAWSSSSPSARSRRG